MAKFSGKLAKLPKYYFQTYIYNPKVVLVVTAHQIGHWVQSMDIVVLVGYRLWIMYQNNVSRVTKG